MPTDISTRITRTKDRWHACLMENGKLLGEMACDSQSNIGFCYDELLRLHTNSDYQSTPAPGRIWYKEDLDKEKGAA